MHEDDFLDHRYISRLESFQFKANLPCAPYQSQNMRSVLTTSEKAKKKVHLPAATPDIPNAKYHFNQTKRYEMCNTAHIVYDFSQSTQTFGELIAVIFKSQSLSLCGLVILGAYNSQYSIRSLIPDTNFDTFCTSKQHKYKQCLCFCFLLLSSMPLHCNGLFAQEVYFIASLFDSIC